MIIRLYKANAGNGYIGGLGNGIVTVNNKPAARKIYLFDAQSMRQLQTVKSKKNGHYIFIGLNQDKKYLMIVRPLATDSETNPSPYGWDYISPASDITVKEQMDTWQSWQDAI